MMRRLVRTLYAQGKTLPLCLCLAHASVGTAATYSPGPIFGPFVDSGGQAHYYQAYSLNLLNGEQYTWEQARTFAASTTYTLGPCPMPGHLLAVESAEENAWILAHASLGGYMGAKGANGQLSWVVGTSPGTAVNLFGRTTDNGGWTNNYLGACAHGEQVLSTIGGYFAWALDPDSGMKTIGGSEFCMLFKVSVEYEYCPTPTVTGSWGRVKTVYR